MSTLYNRSLYILKVDEFPSCNIIETDDGDSINNVLSLLALNNLSSLPIYSSKFHTYIGYVDTKDIVQFLAHGPSILKTHGDSNYQEDNHVNIYKLINAISMKYTCTAASLVDIATRNPFHSLPLGSSIMNVITLMKSERLSRVPIIGKEGRIVKIISQSDLIHCIASFLPECDPNLLSASIKDLKLGFKHMVFVTSSSTAIEALQIMAENKLSSIPVCDDLGGLVTTISDNDIRMASAGYFDESKLDGGGGLSALYELFSLPVIDFVQAIRQGPAHRDARTARFFPTAVRIFPTDTLSAVIEKIASTGLHRLYVTESCNDFTLLGVISLIDIINLLF